MIDHLIDSVSRIKPGRVLLVTNNRFFEPFLTWAFKRKFPFPLHILNDGAGHPEERRGAVLDLYHALSSSLAAEEDSLVLSTDHYFDYPLSLFLLTGLHHLPNPAIGVYDLKDSQLADRYGVIEINQEHRVIRWTQKPAHPAGSLVSVGIYLVSRDAPEDLHKYLERGKRNPDRLDDFFAWLAPRKPALAAT